MISRRTAIVATVVSVLIGLVGLGVAVQQRIAACASVPLVNQNRLPNADFFDADGTLPTGWSAAANGVQLRGLAIDGQGFDLDGNGRAIQLLGIANVLETPTIPVQAGSSYCFTAFALTDSVLASPTRAQVGFVWRSADGTLLREDRSPWQPVVLWQADAPPAAWSTLQAAFSAPAEAASLSVRVRPAADDRIYLDIPRLYAGGRPSPALPLPDPLAPQLGPWPDGKDTAVSFTFDWETAMGGLIHSFSAGDPNADGDPLLRASRMREGITTTIQLFAPYSVEATYFATGYNFLYGNTAREQFLGNPTFAWANAENRWLSDRWRNTPWFADDPYTTVADDPEWYFGDLIGPLQANGHEIQSHTFSHFFGGYVDEQLWQADLATWNRVAVERGVAPAKAIAFPWSSSSGMSDRNWMTLADAGITAVTRLSDLGQYNLFPKTAEGLVADPRCRALPAYPTILACPDFYLTEASADRALTQIDQAIAARGMIDLWAHTEEVVTPAQIAAWDRVVRYAAEHDKVWVAPFGAITDWQAAISAVQVETLDSSSVPYRFRITNPTRSDLRGVTLEFPYTVEQLSVNNEQIPARGPRFSLDLDAGAVVEVQVWPAQ